MKIKDFFDKGYREGFKEKLKFVVMNKHTYEEKFSFDITLIKVFVFLTISSLVLIAVTTVIITVTPLREYIPGYGSSKHGKKILILQSRLDSLQKTINAYDVYKENIRNIFVTEDFSKDTLAFQRVEVKKSKIDKFAFSKEDSMLMQLKVRDKKSIADRSIAVAKHKEKSYALLYTPFLGKIISPFNPIEEQYGIQLLCDRSSAIFAIASGNVILVSKNTKGENIITIQHPDNMISVYKFKGDVLEGQKNIVKQGQIIGKMSNLPNEIYFELWINGKAVNPEDYISF